MNCKPSELIFALICFVLKKKKQKKFKIDQHITKRNKLFAQR